MRDSVEAAANSAIWAAYGDALGWISELVDERGLVRRTRGEPLNDLVSWDRRVGGRSGVQVHLPSGAYSDDTQLRLAVSRSITPDGFDVDAFASVELKVWPAYALGAGRGTKSAAANLLKAGTRWSANFPPGYADMGGNGAAMRVQPHAWRPARPSFDLLRDVLRDAIVTHGNARGIVGAAMHALAIDDLMPGRRRLLLSGGIRAWAEVLRSLSIVESVMAEDPEISAYWLPGWEEASGTTWSKALRDTMREVAHDFERAAEIIGDSSDPSLAYVRVLEALELFTAASRGSGTKTAIASIAAFAINRRFDVAPAEMMRTIVNALGSDTDTIATMFGALIGCVEPGRPPSPPQDWRYIEREATRVARGPIDRSAVQHPDTLHWEAPKTQADALGLVDGQMFVAGLGPVEPIGDVYWDQRSAFGWQWVATAFGQSLLVKRRLELGTGHPEDRKVAESRPESGSEKFVQEPQSADDSRRGTSVPSAVSSSGLVPVAEGLDSALRRVRSSKYAYEEVGRAIIQISVAHGPEVGSALGALIAREVADATR